MKDDCIRIHQDEPEDDNPDELAAFCPPCAGGFGRLDEAGNLALSHPAMPPKYRARLKMTLAAPEFYSHAAQFPGEGPKAAAYGAMKVEPKPSFGDAAYTLCEFRFLSQQATWMLIQELGQPGCWSTPFGIALPAGWDNLARRMAAWNSARPVADLGTPGPLAESSRRWGCTRWLKDDGTEGERVSLSLLCNACALYYSRRLLTRHRSVDQRMPSVPDAVAWFVQSARFIARAQASKRTGYWRLRDAIQAMRSGEMAAQVPDLAPCEERLVSVLVADQVIRLGTLEDGEISGWKGPGRGWQSLAETIAAELAPPPAADDVANARPEASTAGGVAGPDDGTGMGPRPIY